MRPETVKQKCGQAQAKNDEQLRAEPAQWYRLAEPQDRLWLGRRIKLADAQKKIVPAEIATDESGEYQKHACDIQQTGQENLWSPAYPSGEALNWPPFAEHRRNYGPSQTQDCKGEKKSGQRAQPPRSAYNDRRNCKNERLRSGHRIRRAVAVGMTENHRNDAGC